ncbi:MAG TPA: ATP-grasp domain-containing protein [Bordetella sp.]|nr:ATP-grasp domain-containing protein [Bordetella sp.]
MLLLEHDGKQLLADRGIAVAPGVLIDDAAGCATASLPPGPWVVKAQVPVGGRGKAGGIRMADTLDDVAAEVAALADARIRGHAVRGCRVEQRIAGGREAYLSLMVDPAGAGVRVLMSASGGVDIEALARQPGALLSAVAEPEPAAVEQAALNLADQLDGPCRDALRDAARRLAAAFFDMEALLLEINPLFVRAGGRGDGEGNSDIDGNGNNNSGNGNGNGNWVVGDAKIILDDNALARHEELAAMVRARARAYPETAFKLAEDFDYVELDPHGEVGLVTTGAGLSMMLIDQMSEAGLRAFNFLDIRTGQMRGDPHRLLRVFDAMRHGRDIKVLLVNIFAGITHLGEFARLLTHALTHTPALKDLPVVARLIGNGQDEARAILAGGGMTIFMEEDLEAALARVTQLVKAAKNP